MNAILSSRGVDGPSILLLPLNRSNQQAIQRPLTLANFHLFPELPLEIRRMVWDQCISRRLIQWHGSTRRIERDYHELRQQRRPPVVAHVCFEAREVALQFATRLTVASLKCMAPQLAQYLEFVRQMGPGPAPRHPSGTPHGPSATVFVLEPAIAAGKPRASASLMKDDRIWFDTARDTLELPSCDYTERGIIDWRGGRALTTQNLRDCWCHTHLPERTIDGIMHHLPSRVHVMANAPRYSGVAAVAAAASSWVRLHDAAPQVPARKRKDLQLVAYKRETIVRTTAEDALASGLFGLHLENRTIMIDVDDDARIINLAKFLTRKVDPRGDIVYRHLQKNCQEISVKGLSAMQRVGAFVHSGGHWCPPDDGCAWHCQQPAQVQTEGEESGRQEGARGAKGEVCDYEHPIVKALLAQVPVMKVVLVLL